MEALWHCKVCYSESVRKAYLVNEDVEFYCGEHFVILNRDVEYVQEISFERARIILDKRRVRNQMKLLDIKLVLQTYEDNVKDRMVQINSAGDDLRDHLNIILDEEFKRFNNTLQNINQTIQLIDSYQTNWSDSADQFLNNFQRAGLSGVLNRYIDLNNPSDQNHIFHLLNTLCEYSNFRPRELESSQSENIKLNKELDATSAELFGQIQFSESQAQEIINLNHRLSESVPKPMYDSLLTDFRSRATVIRDLEQMIEDQRRVINNLNKMLDLHIKEVYPIQKHTGSVFAVAISADLSRIYSAGSNRRLRIWNNNAKYAFKTIAGHTDEITSMSLAKFDESIVTGSKDDRIIIRNLRTRKSREILTHSGGVLCLKVTDDSRYIITSGSDKLIKVWNYKTGECIHKLEGHSEPVNTLDITPSFSYIVSGSTDCTARVWEVAREYNQSCRIVSDSCILAVAVSKNERFFVTGGYDKIVRVWKLENGELLYRFTEHKGTIHALAVSWNDEYIVSGSGQGDKTIRVWRVLDGQIVDTLKGDGKVLCLAISRDNRYILSGGDGIKRNVMLWYLLNGRD